MGVNGTAIEQPKKTGVNRFSRVDRNMTPYHMKYIQAKAMLDDGKTYEQIHAVTGLAKGTISKVVKGEIELAPSWMNAVKKAESQKLTVLIHQILDSITVEDIQKAPMYQRTTSAAILIDKRRLIDGETTHNIGHAGFLDVLSSDRDELMKRLNSIDGVQSCARFLLHYAGLCLVEVLLGRWGVGEGETITPL